MEEIVSRALGVAFAFLRSLIQGWWAGVVTWAAPYGVVITDEQSALVVALAMALTFAAVVAVLRWMETITGDAPWQRALRGLGKLLMLGTSALRPVYTKPAANQEPTR